MAQTINVNDILDGATGSCYSIIDGNQELMAYVKNIEAKVDKDKTDIKVLGSTVTKHKATGWSGSGSMTIYYVTSKFRKIMLEYMKTGKDTYFDIIIQNDNPNSDMGVQTLQLKNVNLDGIVLGKLDVESTTLEEDIDFTFDGAELLNGFNELTWENS
jgi:hypothetical protein